MLLSQYEFTMIATRWAPLAEEIGIQTDVSRFGAQVINGIGFLGAGTILLTGRQQVKGLTTAAGLWASACMGLAVDAGKLEIVLELDYETMPNDWEKEGVAAKEIQLIQNGQILYQLAPKTRQKVSVEVTWGWIRADLIGEFYEKKDQKIALTNPLYIK